MIDGFLAEGERAYDATPLPLPGETMSFLSRRRGYHRVTHGSKAMTTRLAVFACAALVLGGSGAPANAGQSGRWGHGEHWRATRHAIYELENEIALLEADPAIDDGYRAPVIARARADIFRLRATLHPALWRWTVPCCYSRRPIYIR
jgi:hypothetical protein